MPPVYYLNPPPNPFWDFVAGMEDHPLFRRGGPPQWGPHAFRFRPHPQPQQAQQETPAQDKPEMSEKAKGKQPTVEDPPEVDPDTLQKESKEKIEAGPERGGFPFRGRGRFAGAFDEDGENCRRGGRGGRCGRRGGRGWGGPHHHHGGPPGFPFGGVPFSGPTEPHQGPPSPPGAWPHHPPPHPAGPHGHPHHGPHPHPHGPHGHHGPHRRPSPPPHHQRGPGFNLGEFLNNLGNRLGVDLSGAAEGLGLNKFTSDRRNQEVDFEPRTDIFENKDQYIIHLSLPGAKKNDIGVDWDGENSVLHVAGVVHRPAVDEQMLKELVVDGRKRETGVFEKAIRLGTKKDPASIDVSGITAKMTDGVLIVRVPKVELKHEKREVPIAHSSTPSPQNEPQTSLMDDDMDVDEKTAEPDHETIVETQSIHEESPKEKEAGSEAKEHQEAQKESLPAYTVEEVHDESDWEKYSDEEEGEFVKINVD